MLSGFRKQVATRKPGLDDSEMRRSLNSSPHRGKTVSVARARGADAFRNGCNSVREVVRNHAIGAASRPVNRQ